MIPQYTDGRESLVNRPIPCTNCGATVNGRVNIIRKQDNTVIQEIRWICPRCGTLVRIGHKHG